MLTTMKLARAAAPRLVAAARPAARNFACIAMKSYHQSFAAGGAPASHHIAAIGWTYVTFMGCVSYQVTKCEGTRIPIVCRLD